MTWCFFATRSTNSHLPENLYRGYLTVNSKPYTETLNPQTQRLGLRLNNLRRVARCARNEQTSRKELPKTNR